MLPLLGILGGAYFPEPAEAAEPWPPRDNFFWLGQINKASDIINTDENLLTKEEGKRFAAAIIRNRAVKGGPQHSETETMFSKVQKVLDNNIAWQKNAADKVKNAEVKLNEDFSKML